MENSSSFSQEAQEASKDKGVDSGGEEDTKDGKNLPSPRGSKKEKPKKKKDDGILISEPRDFRVISHIEFDKDSGALKGVGVEQFEEWGKNAVSGSPPAVPDDSKKSGAKKTSLFNF